MPDSQTTSSSLGFSSDDRKESYVHLDNIEWNEITDLNLLATLLSMTSPDKNAFHQAEKILQCVGSLSQITQMSPSDLNDLIPNNRKAVAFINLMRLAMYRIICERTTNQVRISSPAAMGEYVAIHRNPSVGGNRRLILLDRDSRLIRDFSMSVLEDNMVVCGKIAHEALKTDAFGLIVVDYLHSDNLYFSRELEFLSIYIEETMNKINIFMYDHIIVGENRFLSKKENKFISLPENINNKNFYCETKINTYS